MLSSAPSTLLALAALILGAAAMIRATAILAPAYGALVDKAEAARRRSAVGEAMRYLSAQGRRPWMAAPEWSEVVYFAFSTAPLLVYGVSAAGSLAVAAVILVGAAGLIDAKSGLLPGFLTKSALILGLAAGPLEAVPGFEGGPQGEAWLSAAVVLAVLLAVSWAAERLGRPRLGQGDAWLIAAIAAWLGFEAMVHAIGIGLVAALSWGVWRRRDLPHGRLRDVVVRLGPCLAAGFWAVLICGSLLAKSGP